MKLLILTLFSVLAVCRPEKIFQVKSDEMEIEQERSDSDGSITGSYSWLSPEGLRYYVRYVADERGYRVVDSNAVPVSSSGLKADGNQGSFSDDDDSDDVDSRRRSTADDRDDDQFDDDK